MAHSCLENARVTLTLSVRRKSLLWGQNSELRQVIDHIWLYLDVSSALSSFCCGWTINVIEWNNEFFPVVCHSWLRCLSSITHKCMFCFIFPIWMMSIAQEPGVVTLQTARIRLKRKNQATVLALPLILSPFFLLFSWQWKHFWCLKLNLAVFTVYMPKEVLVPILWTKNMIMSVSLIV